MERRVLVVDDYEPWRRHVRLELEKSRDWSVVGEAADGPEAVEKASELKPDLILLDMELPTLSGIEAARRMLTHDPRVRILFVSAHRSWEIVEAAMSAGARGYILKPEAVTDLLPAMTAIAEGKRWVSSSLTGREPGVEHRHEVGLYTDEVSLLDGFVRFAAASLESGGSAIVVLLEERRVAFEQRMRTRSVDLERARREGRYLFFDVPTAFGGFMVDGWPDEGRFWNGCAALILRAAKACRCSPPRVAAMGEGVACLWLSGQPDACIRVEQLWDDLSFAYNVDVFCGYLIEEMDSPDFDAVLESIRQEHTAVESHL
jgi:CheY-like chemotaxis protein